MKISEVVTLTPQERFLYWIKERHQIYIKRKAGAEKPWTDDEILQNYFFTNPYREHDKVTAWFRENIRDPLADSADALFATICFRWFTVPEVGARLYEEGLLQEWDTDRAIDILEEMKEGGLNVFTNAYMIPVSNESTELKVRNVCRSFIGPSWEILNLIKRDELLEKVQEHKVSLATAAKFLGKLPGLGGSGFLTAQVIADLKYTAYLREAPDWWSWCSPGPGSHKGLNILLGRLFEAPMVKDFQGEINKLREIINKSLSKFPKMHAQDVQGCCCEFFKYTKAMAGAGSKRRYDGKPARRRAAGYED